MGLEPLQVPSLLPLNHPPSPRTLSFIPCPLYSRLKAWFLNYLLQNPLNFYINVVPRTHSRPLKSASLGTDLWDQLFWQTHCPRQPQGTGPVVHMFTESVLCSRESCCCLSRFVDFPGLRKPDYQEICSALQHDSQCLFSHLSSPCSPPLRKKDFWWESHFYR